jgi:hypothetical protein
MAGIIPLQQRYKHGIGMHACEAVCATWSGCAAGVHLQMSRMIAATFAGSNCSDLSTQQRSKHRIRQVPTGLYVECSWQFSQVTAAEAMAGKDANHASL